jgi:FkbM family methyltransferase
MARIVRIIVSDFFGLVRVCGLGTALKWLAMIVVHFPQCARQRNLQAPDHAVSRRPLRPRLRGASAVLDDPYAMSSIREIWVRDVYLNGGYLTIPPASMVLDLGANRGFFTALALGSHPDVRCVCVEPRLSDCDRIRHMLKVNGWEGRAEICSAFIGGHTQAQRDMLASEAGLQQEFISEDEFIRRYGLSSIGFLKCDIEGSEFDLLKPGSKLLAMAQQVAVEVHAATDDPKRGGFIQMLRDEGFEVRIGQEDPVGCILSAKRKPSAPAGPASAPASASAAAAATAATRS